VGAKTERVERTIRGLIASGELGPGGWLPSERQLADELGAGRTTVRLVLMELSTEGVIRSEHGRSYFVVPSAESEQSNGNQSRPLLIRGVSVLASAL